MKNPNECGLSDPFVGENDCDSGFILNETSDFMNDKMNDYDNVIIL